jgi:hypothetical protein
VAFFLALWVFIGEYSIPRPRDQAYSFPVSEPTRWEVLVVPYLGKFLYNNLPKYAVRRIVEEWSYM